MKTFMLGWEFPPFISGGLGTACYGLTKAMDQLGIQITFVLPKASSSDYSSHLKIVDVHDEVTEKQLNKLYKFKNVKFVAINSPLQPYVCDTVNVKKKTSITVKNIKETQKQKVNKKISFNDHYSGNLFADVSSYAQKALIIASDEDFDVIHAHDWMTYPAGIAVAEYTKKPLIVHVHSTEFDRSGEHINQTVYDIERQGMHAAARVIAVSNFTKNILVHRYGVKPEKIDVVYNAVLEDNNRRHEPSSKTDEKMVLFLGRVTLQKGPDYFIAAAKKVLEFYDKVKFVIVGRGDMMHQVVEQAARMGIGHKILFTGFLQGQDVQKIMKMADLFVMPSISEPFGIATLEALQCNVPALVSKQSGIAETLTNALKVDFWDVNEMANKIVAVLRHPPLQQTLRTHGFNEVHKFKWENSAEKVKAIYHNTILSAYKDSN